MPKTRNTMTDADFNAMMENGIKQAKAGDSLKADEAFNQILERLKPRKGNASGLDAITIRAYDADYTVQSE